MDVAPPLEIVSREKASHFLAETGFANAWAGRNDTEPAIAYALVEDWSGENAAQRSRNHVDDGLLAGIGAGSPILTQFTQYPAGGFIAA
jgi:hypothetical protein